MSNPEMIAMGRNYKTLSSPCESMDLKPRTEEPMTVKELHTFTDAEIDTIADALRIAAAHYRALSEMTSPRFGTGEFRNQFEAQSHDASTLQLKIEASK